MSETTKKIGWGEVNDTDSSLQTKKGGSFGLNPGFVTKLVFDPNSGADKTPANAVHLTVQIGDREYRNRLFEPGGTLYKGDTKVEPAPDGNHSPDYIIAWNNASSQLQGVLVHAVKALGVTDTAKDAMFAAAPATSFADYATRLIGLVQPGYETRPVDAFLEYQWSIGDDNDRTYLTLPKNMKGGRFLCPSMPGPWKEIITEDGDLLYKNAQGVEHPFTRTKDYMTSPKAYQQVEGEDNGPNVADGSTIQAANTPTQSSWG